MKNFQQSVLCILLVIFTVFSLTSCAGDGAEAQVWDNAEYTADTTFGSGKTTVTVEVRAGDDFVTFTVKTDRETLGAALLEHKLIDGDEGEFGLYLKKVNGITADYDIDQSYWSFYKDGELMPVGVDGARITDGEHYELVYTK